MFNEDLLAVRCVDCGNLVDFDKGYYCRLLVDDTFRCRECMVSIRRRYQMNRNIIKLTLGDKW